MKIRSYPKIFNLGHSAIVELFQGEVTLDEKVDGSQISFMLTAEGELFVQSKGKKQDVNGGADDMFLRAIEEIKKLPLTPDYVYRGELLNKPKHNTLVYDRVPEKGIVIFDIDKGMEAFMSPEEKKEEASRIGLEVAPLISVGIVKDYQEFSGYLEQDSFLGGTKIEGVVVKAYGRFGVDGKTLMGKHVSEKFKEKHQKSWKNENPANRDVIQLLCEELRTGARWEKAIQHLRERGELQNAPQDIGALMKEVSLDTRTEEEEYIKQRLFDWAWKTIGRRITSGLPEWYKERLAQSAFKKGDSDECAT